MAKTKAVKVRKWVTCAEPGCKRRARASGIFCGEHEIKKRDSLRKKFDAGDKKKKEKAAAKKREELIKKKRAVRKKTKTRRAGKAAVASLSRLLKAHCEKCGYTIRLSRKWIEVRRPLCPVCMRNMVVEIFPDLVEEDPRQLPLKSVKKGRADPGAAKKIGKH